MNAKDIIDAITETGIFWGGFYAVYRATIDWNQIKNVRLAKEHEEMTKRIEIQAKESSLGQEALMFLKTEIIDLKNDRLEDKHRIERIQEAIKALEFIYKIVENRYGKISNTDQHG